MVISPQIMPKPPISDYLREALKGTTQVEHADRLKLTRPVLNRLVKGDRPPTAKQMLKLAVYLDEHPARLFDLSGDYESADLFRALMPEKDGEASSYDLCRRVRLLAQRGMSQAVDKALAGIELLWELPRQGFEELAQDMGCRAACLVADHRVKDDVVYRWQVSEEEAARLAQDRKRQGWRRFSHRDPVIHLDLFLLGGRPNRSSIETGLSGIARNLSAAVQGR